MQGSILSSPVGDRKRSAGDASLCEAGELLVLGKTATKMSIFGVRQTVQRHLQGWCRAE